MTVLHVLLSLDPRGGGPIRSVAGVCRGLAKDGVNTVLFVHSPEHPLSDPSGVRFLVGRGTYFRTIVQDAIRVINEIKPDIIHLHGVWAFSNHVWAHLARKKRIPYVIAPRGMLEPWSLNTKKWKKRLAMWLYQRRDIKMAVALHATAKSEADQLRRLGFRQAIIVLPNGVDFPANMPMRLSRTDCKRTALFLSRIHPKKGVMELVEAWAKIKEMGQERETGDGVSPNKWVNWHFEYAGPDYGGHLAKVQKRILELGLEEDFTYLGELNDTQKWEVYGRADLFVLPTYSENFGIVIAEALVACLPVVTTRGAPWEELESEHCGWWIETGIEPLAKALRDAMSLTDEKRLAMGENGRRLVDAKYAWSAIAEQMKGAYDWVLNRGRRTPSYIAEIK